MDNQPVSTTLVSAARDVAAAAAQSAPAAERNRRLDPDVVKAVVAAGFSRHFVPVECGGSLGSFLELTRAVSALGEGCTATAWCASLAAHLSRMAAHLPAEGYREIWADGPDVLVVGSLTPLGKAEPVAGGYHLTGKWPFVSAIDYADWTLLAANVAREGAPEPRVFAVPRSAWQTVDTWHNVGMAATGSNTVVVDDVFVPAARTVSRDDLFAGRAVDSDAACHSLPMQATSLMFVTPALGAAKGAFSGWVKHITPKIDAAAKVTTAPLPGMPRFNRTSHDVTLARSAAEIDAAELLLERASEVADLGRAVTPYLTMRNWRDCAQATDMLITVVNRLFRGMGTTGQTTGNSVQRFWRDLNSLAGHQGLQFESAATAYSHEVIAL